MPKRRSASSKGRIPGILGLLLGLALTLFLAGELFAFFASDTGRLFLYRHLHVGDRAAITRIVGKRLHAGLAAARVPAAALSESPLAGVGGPALRWRVTLPRDGSPLQVNFALSEALERGGAVVLAARERPGEGGALVVTLLAGLPGLPTHEVIVTRPGRARDEDAKREARIAVLLVGLSDDLGLARDVLARHAVFAVAVPAIGDARKPLLAGARAGGHEVVLQLPMEPENYPRVNPGAGTLLVSMPAGRIAHDTGRFVDQSAPVVAVANLMGSFATQDGPFMTAFFQELNREHLGFVHLAPVPRAVCRALASQLGVACDEGDFTLDAETHAKRPDALARTWKQALEHARAHGSAIVIIHVTPLSAHWLDTALTPKGLAEAQLVPLSSLLHHPAAR